MKVVSMQIPELLDSCIEIDALWDYQSKGAIVVTQPAKTNSGWKEFIIQDLDGYKMGFGGS